MAEAEAEAVLTHAGNGGLGLASCDSRGVRPLAQVARCGGGPGGVHPCRGRRGLGHFPREVVGGDHAQDAGPPFAVGPASALSSPGIGTGRGSWDPPPFPPPHWTHPR